MYLKKYLATGALASALSVSAFAGETFGSFLKGCDMSFTDQNQAAGFQFEDSSGTPSDPFALLASHGVNYVRLRVFVEGSNDLTPGVWNNEFETLKIAKQAKAQGLKIELDFMYSDALVGAGNGVEAGPAAWSADQGNATALQADVYNFTKKVLQAMANQGTAADMVQIGNEINDGIVWTAVGSDYYKLIYEGCKATRDVDGTIGIVLHWACDNTVAAIDGRVSSLVAALPFGVHIPFDAIGISYYPWFNSNNTVANLSSPSPALGFLWGSHLGSFGRPVLVQETGFPWTESPENGTSPKHPASKMNADGSYGLNPTGAHQYIIDMMNGVRGATQGIGVFYWPADDVTGWGAGSRGDYQAAMWDSVNQQLKATSGGTTIISAFTH